MRWTCHKTIKFWPTKSTVNCLKNNYYVDQASIAETRLDSNLHYSSTNKLFSVIWLKNSQCGDKFEKGLLCIDFHFKCDKDFTVVFLGRFWSSEILSCLNKRIENNSHSELQSRSKSCNSLISKSMKKYQDASLERWKLPILGQSSRWWLVNGTYSELNYSISNDINVILYFHIQHKRIVVS